MGGRLSLRDIVTAMLESFSSHKKLSTFRGGASQTNAGRCAGGISMTACYQRQRSRPELCLSVARGVISTFLYEELIDA
ncbi:hypothetical protein KIN20_037266 [Parelaphostrongylus tenuis]|uniref:Uncharacterized protein n=1 Tax=Parelaphostrongylus tenuis TaxID=148309 RepID=A0AAD5WMB5_PARTN|nr:hypothetical protein KIN20_037266 [Parelaphostrongylus tenuis]